MVLSQNKRGHTTLPRTKHGWLGKALSLIALTWTI